MPVSYKDLGAADLRSNSTVQYVRSRDDDEIPPPEAAGFHGDTVFMMVTRPQQSADFQTTAFNSTLLRFNPDWFNTSPTGTVQFIFEIEARNLSAGDLPVIIRNSVSLAVIHTFTIPAGQVIQTYQADVFVPPAGEAIYQMVIPQTAVNDEIQVIQLGIRVRCAGVLTPVFYYPYMFTGLGINRQDLVCGDSRFVIGGDTGYIQETNAGLFLKEAGGYAVVDHWSLDSVAGNTGFLGTSHCFVALTRSDGSQVVENDHITTFSAVALETVDFADGAANFTDGDEFTIFSRETATAASNSLILKVGIYVFLSDFAAASAFFHVGETRMPIAPAITDVLASVWFETSAEETGAGTAALELVSAVLPQINSAETVVAGSQIDPVGAALDRYRVPVVLALNELYYNSAAIAGTGTYSTHGTFVILKVTV